MECQSQWMRYGFSASVDAFNAQREHGTRDSMMNISRQDSNFCYKRLRI